MNRKLNSLNDLFKTTYSFLFLNIETIKNATIVSKTNNYRLSSSGDSSRA